MPPNLLANYLYLWELTAVRQAVETGWISASVRRTCIELLVPAGSSSSLGQGGPRAWSLRPVCYLEDLFVATAARGEGAGRALIEALVTLGREHGWRRVYWHAHENNERARTLYDRLAKRTDYVRYDIEF
jgi:GNAT superfamily N-acetyltransferase